MGEYTRWHNGERIIGGMIEIGAELAGRDARRTGWPTSTWWTPRRPWRRSRPPEERVMEEPRDIPGNGRFADRDRPARGGLRDHRPPTRGPRAQRRDRGRARRMSGDLVYFQLNVADGEKAKAFYSGLFGWTASPGNVPGGINFEGPSPPGGAFAGGETDSRPARLLQRGQAGRRHRACEGARWRGGRAGRRPASAASRSARTTRAWSSGSSSSPSRAAAAPRPRHDDHGRQRAHLNEPRSRPSRSPRSRCGACRTAPCRRRRARASRAGCSGPRAVNTITRP